MGDRKIPHVGDIFGGGRDVSEERATYQPHNIMDRTTSFNYKNKRAPQPPGNLPKIGNYQPKSLLTPKPYSHGSSHDQNNRNSQQTGPNQSHIDVISRSPPRAMVIGDKDVPLRIEPTSDSEQPFVSPVAPPRRKRQAPSAPDAAAAVVSVNQRNNPLFGRSMSQRSDEERFNMQTFEEQGGDIDFASGIDNPAFLARSRATSDSSYHNYNEHKVDSSDRTGAEDQYHHIEARTHGSALESSRPREDRYSHVNMPRNAGDHGEYPYIPPPDYQDEEVTMDFHEEPEALLKKPHPLNGNHFSRDSKEHSAYRELEGDDFGRYLEDDYELNRPGNRSSAVANRNYGKGKSAPKHKPNNKDQKHKRKHSKNDAKRNTIRDFAFSDSKIGWGDRTVKSTSAKGRYIKREKDRRRIDTSEARVPNGGTGSYEEFLKVRNGLPLDSPNSSDSGVELADDPPNMDMYIHSQPKQMKYRKYDEKPNLLQRLTWRFRKMSFSRNRDELSPAPQMLSERL
ncbi:uncharacterized protein LOC127841076 [Dreissena polymorpha]|uniref:Uncharacterized protein n=1 Tax=Dreissena polymorpha TaxID=45954 RepID=A0A9D4ERG5_DREPO|nr:uncharacterized protein LOC127841076 [Dreissena polymorpha]XP_052225587.1 uncharacterized protein LOC127841076 [Dreissena polymorpha]KAH3782642.1 hypothetical protein DPMN_160561 [Dreissena polymorpha]